MTVPNSGDVLPLSQVSLKISRVFAQRNVPIDLRSVETEITQLAVALKQLAEALHAERGGRLLQESAEQVQHDIGTILDACKQTIKDLDILVDRNQVTKKHRTVGGFAIERVWSDSVLTEFPNMIWTTEGGDLHSLKSTLKIHTNSVVLLTQALQSMSHSHLESVVYSITDCTDGGYRKHGNSNQKLDEVPYMVESLETTNRPAPSPPIPMRNPARPPTMEATNILHSNAMPVSTLASSSKSLERGMPHPKPPMQIVSSFVPESPPRKSSAIIHVPSSPTDTMSTSRASSPTYLRMSDFSIDGSSLRFSGSSYASSTASSGGWSSPGTPLIAHQPPTASKRNFPLPRTPEVREPDEGSRDNKLSLLPPPALGYAAHSRIERPISGSTVNQNSSAQPDVVKLHRSSTTSSQKAAFEKEAFRNSAVLCDVRGKQAEYSHQINEDDPRDVEMVQVCDECRIAVVRKRVHDPETRAIRVVTSIWVFSDDNTVRMELRMDDQQMYIPYVSYFSPTKVSITVPCELKFHDVKLGNRPSKLAQTSWVNYVFDTPQDAALFQNELMGRTLLATFRTEKTMRVHEGIGKSFSYAEQMCGLETLRIWEDNDTGAIIALIHFSADFRNGYLAFYLNSSVNPIKVKDEGNREVKIKGLRVPIDRGDKAMRKDSVVALNAKEKGKGKEEVKKVEKEKVISGAKIEFASDMEKREFIEMVKEVQRDMIELPDLLGVNGDRPS